MSKQQFINRFIKRVGTITYKVALISIYFFSIFPILLVGFMSFNDSQRLEFPPSGFTLQWYAEATARYSEFIQPLLFSLYVALIAAVVAGTLGTLAALALARYSTSRDSVLKAYYTTPLTIPHIVIGLAVLIYFHQIGFPRGTLALVISHSIAGLPFVIIFVFISVRQYNNSLELSGHDLGADKYQVFRHITLPLIKPGIFAGVVFTFIISFNNVALSLFLIRPGQTTLPLVIFSNLEYGFTPTLAAVAVIQVTVILGIVAIFNRIADIEEII